MFEQCRGAWLRDAGWGVFTHYLADQPSATGATDMSVTEWNARVESFDVARLADQLEQVGARYYGITLGQNSGFYCAPNATYDAIVGRRPSRCSSRDLPAELAFELARRGIRFMLYLPSGAPDCDALAMEKLMWTNGNGPAGPKRLAEFQLMWESVIGEWALRYGDGVSAWWVDGCYFGEAMYDHDTPPNYASLTSAFRAGNPNAAVALNPGIRLPVVSLTRYEDYTAGEVDTALPVHDQLRPAPTGGLIGGSQYHILSFLGDWWCGGSPRFPDDLVVGYTRYANAVGAAITWDVPISPAGSIPGAYLAQLGLLADPPLASRPDQAPCGFGLGRSSSERRGLRR